MQATQLLNYDWTIAVQEMGQLGRFIVGFDLFIGCVNIKKNKEYWQPYLLIKEENAVCEDTLV